MIAAATFFAQAFFIAWLLPIAPGVVDISGFYLPAVGLTGAWILFMVANVVLAVALWRTGRSRVASGLMILGAVLTPVIGPFGAGTLALGLGRPTSCRAS